MKTFLRSLAITFAIILSSCSKDDAQEEVLSSDNIITQFQLQINGQSVNGQINSSDNTVVFNVVDASLNDLSPTISIPDGARITPASGVKQDFNKTITYTVTVENGDTRAYRVTVNNTIRSAKNFINRFQLTLNDELIDGTIDQDAKTIVFDVAGADLSALSPVIEYSEKATIDPSPEISQNFNESVIYTVTAENGDENSYTVTVNNRPLSSEKQILNFTVGINGEDIPARIDHEQKVIAFETGSFNISKLTPHITVSEYASITPASGTEINFNDPVTFTVTAENGETTEYSVSINEAYNLNAGTRYGSYPPKLYNGGRLYINTNFLDLSKPGVELYLFDGTNRTDIPIQNVTSQEYNRIINYYMEAIIPMETVTSSNYQLIYEYGDLKVTSDIVIDILAEGAPEITGVNQDLYKPGDTLIITGKNLIDRMVVPSNGNYYLFFPTSKVDITLSEDKTEFSLFLEYQSSHAYSAFFFYSGDTRDVIFMDQDKRVGAHVTVNVQ